MKNLLVLFAAMTVLAGCGVIDMPYKMDKSNDNMQTMIKGMSETNEQMSEMIKGMAHTNEGMDKQTNFIPFENMLKAENAVNLSPVPSRLIPFGKNLALVITAADMAELTHLWLKEVNEGAPEKKKDSNGNDIDFTPEEIVKIDHDKMALIVGLQIISGFLPQARVEELIQQQIYKSGTYEEDVYAILMFRKMFIQDILLDGDLLSTGLKNVGMVTLAVELNAKIDFLAKLPFYERIQIKTTGFLDPSANIEDSFKPAIALQNWKAIQKSAEEKCKVTEKSVLTGNPAEDERLYQERLRTFENSMSTIQSYLGTWRKAG